MNKDFQQKIADLCKSIHRLERILKETEIFKGQLTPFKSPKLQIAFNEIQSAHMFAGDCLRLLVLDIDWQNDQRFIPSEHGGTWEQDTGLWSLDMLKNFSTLEDKSKEKVALLEIKMQIRRVFYETGDLLINAVSLDIVCNANFSIWEWEIYSKQLLIALKKADQQLGFRLGELA